MAARIFSTQVVQEPERVTQAFHITRVAIAFFLLYLISKLLRRFIEIHHITFITPKEISFLYLLAVVALSIKESFVFADQFRKYLVNTGRNTTSAQFITKAIKIVSVISILLVFGEHFGLSFAGLLTFGGIGGIAIGLAGKDILSKIYVDIICSTDDSHSFDNFVAKDHYQNLSQVSDEMYIITSNGSSATIKLKNLEKWLENYESSCLSGTYDGTHTIVDYTESIQLDCKDGKWSISGEDTFTIKISCSPDTPEIPSVEDLFSNIFVNIECTTDPQHSRFHYTNLSSIANGKEEEQIYYIINQYGKDAMIALANLDEWIASYVQNYYPDINHISVDEKPDSIALVYDEKTKEWNGIRDLVIKIACDTEEEKPAPPTDKWIGDHLKAIVDCVNEEAKHNPIPLILSGIYGEDYWQISDVKWDESRGHYTVEVSIPNIEKYVTAYETQYGEHTFMEGYPGTVTTLHLIYDTESNGWSCLEDENGNPLDSFFLFVECKTPTPPEEEKPEEENPESEDSEPPKGHTVTRHDDDDDWEPLPNNNYTIKKKQETKPLQQETIVVPEATNNTVKVNPETGDTTTAFAAMALAAVSLGGVVLLGRKKK